MEQVKMRKAEVASYSSCGDTGVYTGDVRTELFSMEIQTCVIVGDDTEIQIVKLSDVFSFFCVCRECGKRFVAKSKLKAHMKIHFQDQENVSTRQENESARQPNVSTAGTSDLSGSKIEEIENSPGNSGKAPMGLHRMTHGTDEVGDGEDDSTPEDDDENSEDDGENDEDDEENDGTRDEDGMLRVEARSKNVSAAKNPGLKLPDNPRSEDVQNLDRNRNESGSGTLSNRPGRLPHHCEPRRMSNAEIDTLIEKQSLSGKSGSVKCNICWIEVAGGRQTFRRHLKRHTGDKPYICSVCGRGYSTKSELDGHVRVHTGDPYACQVCGKQFGKSRSLRIHSKIHQDKSTIPQGEPFSCTLCDKKFRHKCTVNVHMRTHTGIKPHVCPFCGKAFANPSNMKCHVMIHTGKKPHLCTTCGKTFPSTSNLKTHMRLHTEERPFLCTICGKRFTHLSSLNLHVCTHKVKSSFSCSLCDRAFKYESSLKQHVKINHEDNSLTCDVCGKVFKHYIYLKSHLRTHDKPYICSGCGKSFSSKYPYDNHMRLHTGEKPYTCSHCVQTFRLRTSLMEHIKAQHPETIHPTQSGTTSTASEDKSSNSDMNWNVGSLIEELTNVTSEMM